MRPARAILCGMSTTVADIVIPFYNRADLLSLCLRALERAAGPELGTVIVVDDASQPAERAAIDALAPGLKLPLRVVSHAQNAGFVAAIRTGMDHVTAQHVVLLNSDTVPTPGFVRDLVGVMRERPEVKAVAPISNASSDLFQYRAYAQVAPGSAAEMLPNIARVCAEARRTQLGKVTLAPFLTGMCLALDTAAFRAQGCFSEHYEHGYFEDLDLCCRLRAAGHALAIREDCFVYHRGQGSYRLLENGRHGELMRKNFERYCARWGHLPEHRALLECIERAAMQP